MTVVTLQQAQAQLLELLDRAEAGEDIVIAREIRPAVRLALIPHVLGEPDAAKPPRRTAGALAHLRGKIPDDFFDPLLEEELRLWEDGPVYPPEKLD